MTNYQAATPPVEPVAALERERLTALINSMGDAVLAVDEHQRVAVYNGAALNILDLNSDLRNRRLSDILQLIDGNNQLIDVRMLVSSTKRQFVSRDLRLKYPNDETINVYLSLAPVHLGYKAKGQRGHVLLLRDITHEKSLEEERDEFISVVSHELRTPIAIAEGNISNAQFIVDKLPTPPLAVAQSLKTAHDQVLFLGSMINDLATLSRAERGSLTLDIDTINVVTLLHELRQAYIHDAEQKGLELTLHPDPELHTLHSSTLYVREILQNFITNALKYTETGHISIGATQRSKGVLFEVTDSGIGLSKADQSRVFDKFFRSEDYRIRETSGTGLGLYVTLKLAKLIHAELDLKSELDKGSTFSVFVPNLE